VASDLLAAAPERRSRAHRATLGAFVALGVAAGSWGSRIPDIRDHLDLAEGSLGTALLGLSVGAVAGAWLGGLLVRRFGSRRVVTGAWLLVGALLVLPGAAGTWAQLALGLLALGLGIGVLDVSMNGAGIQLEAAAARPLLNGLHAGWSGGVLVGAALGSLAVAAGLAVGAHLALAGAVIVVSGTLLGPAAPDGRIATGSHQDDAAAGGVPPRRRHRWRLPALAAIGGFLFLSEGAMLDWFGVLVREDLDGGEILGAVAVTGFSAGGLAGRLLGDRLTLRWGAGRLVRLGVVVSGAGLAFALASPSAVPVPVLLVVVGAGMAPAIPLAFAAAGRIHGEHGIAVVTTAGYGCYLAGPALIGWLADAVGLHTALLVPLALILAVVALAWSTSDLAPFPT